MAAATYAASRSLPPGALFLFVSRLLGDLVLGQPLPLIPPVERLDKALGLAPARLDDDVQLQINACADERLNMPPGAGADLLELGAALADQDRLLAVALAINRRRDAGERQPGRSLALLARRSWRLGLLESLDDHGRGVGDLFAGLDQNALADQLGDHEALRLVGVLVLGVVALAGGQCLDDLAGQKIESVALAGADGNDLGKTELPGEGVDQRQEIGKSTRLNSS